MKSVLLGRTEKDHTHLAFPWASFLVSHFGKPNILLCIAEILNKTKDTGVKAKWKGLWPWCHLSWFVTTAPSSPCALMGFDDTTLVLLTSPCPQPTSTLFLLEGRSRECEVHLLTLLSLDSCCWRVLFLALLPALLPSALHHSPLRCAPEGVKHPLGS